MAYPQFVLAGTEAKLYCRYNDVLRSKKIQLKFFKLPPSLKSYDSNVNQQYNPHQNFAMIRGFGRDLNASQESSQMDSRLGIYMDTNEEEEFLAILKSLNLKSKYLSACAEEPDMQQPCDYGLNDKTVAHTNQTRTAYANRTYTFTFYRMLSLFKNHFYFILSFSRIIFNIFRNQIW